MPGFTAEASLYEARESYRVFGSTRPPSRIVVRKAIEDALTKPDRPG
jgi:hypothetical protein